MAATWASRDLSKLFDPASVAIVGASDDPDKYGNWVALRALRDTRPTHFVNRSREMVLGRRTVPSLASLKDQVDLVVIAVPAVGFEQTVDDALAAGARAIVGITAGLGELGGEDLRRQHAMVDRVRGVDAVLLGPNSFGVLDHSTGLEACASTFPRGSVALISQSGNLAMDIAAHLHVGGLGVSRLASIGNQADVDVADLIDSCVGHEPTRAIAVYCEGFPAGRRFVQACANADAAGKPVVLLTVGRGAASVRGAASHTGSLVTSQAVMQAVCDAVGAELVATPAEMAHLLQALTRTAMPPGPRVGVFADGGGHGSLACDALEHQGLVVEPFTEHTSSLAATQLPLGAGTSNPIDIAGAGERDLDSFYQISRLLVEDTDIDAVLLAGYFGGYRGYGATQGRRELEVARQIGRLVTESGQTFVAHLMFDRSPASRALRAAGVAVFRDVAAAAWALHRLWARAAATPTGVPRTPEPAAPISSVGYWPARRALAAAGVPFVPAVEVRTWTDVEHALPGLDFPLVLKALGEEHKSDTGGVWLGITDRDALDAAWRDVHARLDPPTCSLEQMADLGDAVEIIVGVRRDSSFGTIVLVGLGGVHTELLQDTQCALGPLTPATAVAMLGRLRGAPLFRGFRGRPDVDVAAAGELISSLSWFAAAHPEVSELECNPVAVGPTGAVALDARIILGADWAGSPREQRLLDEKDAKAST